MPISLNDLAAFSEQDVADVLADELADSAERYKPVSKPTAILLAGRPGAGKTELASAMSGLLADNVFFINADEYRRRHPNYRAIYTRCGSDSVQMTSAFSSTVTERLIEALSNRHLKGLAEQQMFQEPQHSILRRKDIQSNWRCWPSVRRYL